MHTLNACGKYVLTGVVAATALASLEAANAGVAVLYAFQGGGDGAYPKAALFEDSAGNLYGTTSQGGGTGCKSGSQLGCGTVFRLAADGTEAVLYAFHGRKDGGGPVSAVIQDKRGNLFGTTPNSSLGYNVGTVFKLTPKGRLIVLHAFTGEGGDGAYPQAGVIQDEAGNLYGTTRSGGAPDSCHLEGDCGTVFKIAPDGVETVLYDFLGGKSDGAHPMAGVIQDKAGNLYGTTSEEGDGNCYGYSGYGCGTVFKLAGDTESTVYVFAGRSDGAFPQAPVIRDKGGTLYGTTFQGGSDGCYDNRGCGTVFKLSPDGTETVIYAFAGGKDGAYPEAGLIQDKAGNFYGTTSGGGGSHCEYYVYSGCGTVFRIAPDGTESVLHSFRGSDGEFPNGLIKDKAGYLYGTTLAGGGGSCRNYYYAGCGTVFRLRK